MGDFMVFKDCLKHLRKINRMTQADLSEKTGLAIGTIRQYEGGIRNPSYEALYQISTAFNVSDINLLYDASSQNAKEQIEQQKEPDPKTGLEKDEKELVENYEALNREGKEILLNTSRGLVASGQYQEGLRDLIG